MYYLEIWKESFGIWHLTFGIYFKNLYQANETRYIDSEVNLRSPFNFKIGTENSKGNCSENLNCNCLEVLDNAAGKSYSEVPGRCYNVKCSDQQRGAVHPVLRSMDVKFVKVCSIILFIVMTLAFKVSVMLTINMGTLFLKSVLFLKCYNPSTISGIIEGRIRIEKYAEKKNGNKINKWDIIT